MRASAKMAAILDSRGGGVGEWTRVAVGAGLAYGVLTAPRVPNAAAHT